MVKRESKSIKRITVFPCAFTVLGAHTVTDRRRLHSLADGDPRTPRGRPYPLPEATLPLSITFFSLLQLGSSLSSRARHRRRFRLPLTIPPRFLAPRAVRPHHAPTPHLPELGRAQTRPNRPVTPRPPFPIPPELRPSRRSPISGYP